MDRQSLLRLLATLLMGVAVVGEMRPDAVGDYAVGRRGDALKRTLRQHCTPTALLNLADYTREEYLAMLAGQQTLADGSGRVADAVTAHLYHPGELADLSAIAVVDAAWMGFPAEYGRNSAADLYNAVATCAEVVQLRTTAKAWATVAAATSVVEGDGWRSGEVPFDGWGDVPVVEPADDAKGPLARRIMYVATIYPCSAWYGDAPKFFTSAEYPGLTDYAAATYLAWHRDHPVTAAERQANDAVEQRQGNRNPFVDHPDLAEYLWGSHAGEMYPGGSGDPDDGSDDGPTAAIPLRGAYSIAADGHLDLYSPYVPAGVAWTVDGIPADATRLDLATLGVGRHELRYTAATDDCAGKLAIEITP